MHRVRDLIPTLDWEGGALGVRLRYEPTDLTILYKDFITAVAEAEALREVATAQQAAGGSGRQDGYFSEIKAYSLAINHG